MSRRRRKSSDGDDLVGGLFQLFHSSPWFTGPIVAVAVYVLLGWVAPWFCPPVKDGDSLENKKPADFFISPIGMIAKAAAPYAGVLVLAVWGIAQIVRLADRKQLDQIDSLDGIKGLSWQEFERLLCEAFRRQGHAVEHTGRGQPDGGVDVRLRKGKQLSLVQCKHWKKWSVGVSVIREMLGIVTSERAQWGIVVTSGTFTPDAVKFADRNSIQLIDGDELARLIASVQAFKRRAWGGECPFTLARCEPTRRRSFRSQISIDSVHLMTVCS